MQVEHLTVFVFMKTRENIKDTLVGRLAKQQRTNNIKQRNVEMQISVRLALVALTACQLTPYGPLSISNSQYVVCSMSLYSSIYIFSANTFEHAQTSAFCFTQLYSECWIDFVYNRFVFKDRQLQLEKSACEEGRII